nr:retrovirus-related Pol polyprotein from transposon TNT 1-94 [Tanacetum cinerariifolium]
NTIDPLGKFDEKADEGFLVGYSVNCKAFRVFNSRTKIVQETLHINFIENQPNIVGSGTIWLFNIDTLNQSMNYQPVVAGNQPNHNAGIQENLDAGTVGKEVEYVQLYVLLPLWSTGLKDPQNIDTAARTIRSKWLFKKKTDMDGAVYIFKARLVAKGFTKTYGVDYEETFSPVADIRAIRILIATAMYYDYEI